jgi:MoxR-like ATPase
VVCALLADGHVLLEDYPGSGKTTLAKALGDAIMRHGQDEKFSSFGRVQFTPDLLPSDVTGASIFDEEKKQFVFRPGPIFTNVLLADEINRTSPKVQAALLEAMAEKQVTADAGTQKLEEIFFVLATQNPLDLVGTYPLPQAQLDRFLFKIKMAHLKRECEIDVLARWKAARAQATPIQVTPAMLIAARNVIGQTVTVHPHFYAGLVDIANNLRRDSRVLLGISTRSLVLALPALQTWAAINGRDYVSAEDIKALAIPIFSHRLTLQPGQKDADTIVMECIAPVVEALTRATMR